MLKLSEELAEAEGERGGGGGEEYSPRTVGLGMTVGWSEEEDGGGERQKSTSYYRKTVTKMTKTAKKASPPMPPAKPRLTETLDAELEESRRKIRQRRKKEEEEEEDKDGVGGGMLSHLAELKRRFGDAESIGDNDFEEMADAIQSILSGEYRRGVDEHQTGAAPMPSRTVPIQKPPRRDLMTKSAEVEEEVDERDVISQKKKDKKCLCAGSIHTRHYDQHKTCRNRWRNAWQSRDSRWVFFFQSPKLSFSSPSRPVCSFRAPFLSRIFNDVFFPGHHPPAGPPTSPTAYHILK